MCKGTEKGLMQKREKGKYDYVGNRWMQQLSWYMEQACYARVKPKDKSLFTKCQSAQSVKCDCDDQIANYVI